jgi:hypothetical protein
MTTATFLLRFHISLSLPQVSGFFTGDCNVPQLSQLLEIQQCQFRSWSRRASLSPWARQNP